VPVPGILIVRMDATLYYANALTVRDRVRELIAEADPAPRALILDFPAQDELDFTAAEMLAELVKELGERGIEIVAADVHAPVHALAQRYGVAMDASRFFPSVQAALESLGASDAG